MAVAAQEQITPEAPRPSKPARRRAAIWPKPSQLKQSVPILRLLAEIWSIPQVATIAVAAEGATTSVRVIIPEIDRAAMAGIYAAERQYLNTTPPHDFELRVVSHANASVAVPPPFEAVLER
jgi:hypothetical protein